MFSALLSAVVFGRSLDSPELKSQILWENFEKIGETLRQHLPSLSALVRFLISWGGPGGPGGPPFARESTVWTRSERSLFPFLLSFTFIVCGCFVKFLCTSVKHSSPSIAFSFSCFSLKVQGETDGGGELVWCWPGGLALCCGKQHERLMEGGLTQREMTPTFTKEWSTVMHIDVRTWNEKYGALLDSRRGDSGDRTRGEQFKCSENSLYGSGWTASRPPASLHETEQTFHTWKAAVTAPGCYLA